MIAAHPSQWLSLSLAAALLGGLLLAGCALPERVGNQPAISPLEQPSGDATASPASLNASPLSSPIPTAVPTAGSTASIPGATPSANARPTGSPVATLPPFTPQPAHNPGVADLLKYPPPAGQSVEVDAYFNSPGVSGLPGGPPPPADRVACPQTWKATLTDRPYLSTLSYLNGIGGRLLPEDTSWLVATSPEQTRPGARTEAQLPYHARLRGHLGDPAFSEAGCVHAERIFVVEQVVKVYQQDIPTSTILRRQLPDGYAAWPRYADARFGYSLPYPPDWQVERLDDVTLALAGSQWPGNPLIVRVHQGEVHYDQYDPASASPLLKGQGWGVFSQGSSPYDGAGSQGLDGYTVDRYSTDTLPEQTVSVLFSAHGYTFELALTYPTGFGASQELLNLATAMVQGFRLDKLPAPSPTPPVKQQLGREPFLSQEQALAAAEQRVNGKLVLLSAHLVSEAESRQVGGPWGGPCGSYVGHPDGVWLLVVRGVLSEEPDRTFRLYLDAATGEQLCGAEIEVDAAQPVPPATEQAAGTPVPADTATPYPTGHTAPASAPTPTRHPESTSATSARAFLEGKAFQVLAYEGTADTYVLTKEKLVGLPYMIYWGLQTVNPEPYVGKTIEVEKFLVRNHPLDQWTPTGRFVTPAPAAGQTQVFVFVVGGQAVGGTAFPPAAGGMAGGYWSLDGKTLEEVHGVQDFQAWREAWVAKFGGTSRP